PFSPFLRQECSRRSHIPFYKPCLCSPGSSPCYLIFSCFLHSSRPDLDLIVLYHLFLLMLLLFSLFRLFLNLSKTFCIFPISGLRSYSEYHWMISSVFISISMV